MNNSAFIHQWIHNIGSKKSHGNLHIEKYMGRNHLVHYSTSIAKKENGAVFISTRNYSNTTCKVQGLLRKAASHLPVVYVYQINMTDTEVQERLLQDIKNATYDLKRKRVGIVDYYDWIFDFLVENYKNFMRYSSFDVNDAEVPTDILPPFPRGYYEDKEKPKPVTIENINAANNYKAKCAEWWENSLQSSEAPVGKAVYKKILGAKTVNDIVNLDFVKIRRKMHSEDFETSKGIVIPKSILDRYLPMIEDGSIKVGDKIMGYSVSSFSSEEITLGCHKFNINYLKERYSLIK